MITEYDYNKLKYYEQYLKAQYAKRGINLSTKILGKTVLFYNANTNRTLEVYKLR